MFEDSPPDELPRERIVLIRPRRLRISSNRFCSAVRPISSSLGGIGTGGGGGSFGALGFDPISVLRRIRPSRSGHYSLLYKGHKNLGPLVSLLAA